MLRNFRFGTNQIEIDFKLRMQSTSPMLCVGVCCSHKVIALGFNTLCYDTERRGIKPSARIKETIITADALLCQKEIVKKIAKDNDYILALKGNHPLMEQEVKDFFLKPCTIDSERPYDL